MYGFQYDYVKLCYMDTGSFIVYIVYIVSFIDIVEDLKTRFDTSDYELDRLLPKGKNKNVIGHMKDNQVEKS